MKSGARQRWSLTWVVPLLWQAILPSGAAAQAPVPQAAPAQTAATPPAGRGSVAASLRLAVTDSEQGAFTQVIPRIGYDSGRWGVGLSVPFEHIGAPASTPTAGGSGGLGDMRVSLSYARTSERLNYFWIASLTAPTGDATAGLGAGTSTWDWTHHINHYFERFTPFVDLGLGSSVGSGTSSTLVTGSAGQTRTFASPYTTIGKVAHLDAGLDWYIRSPFSWSMSWYNTLPWGDQEAIDLFVPRTPSGQLGPRRRRSIDVQTTTTTADSSSFTADHGFSTSIDVSPTSYFYASVGFSRSVRRNINAVTVSAGVNLVRLYRETRRRP